MIEHSNIKPGMTLYYITPLNTVGTTNLVRFIPGGTMYTSEWGRIENAAMNNSSALEGSDPIFFTSAHEAVKHKQEELLAEVAKLEELV